MLWFAARASRSGDGGRWDRPPGYSLSDLEAHSDPNGERVTETTPTAGPSSLSDLVAGSDPTGSGP